MAGYSFYIHKRICTALLKCNEFKSDEDLHAAFADPRINMWQDTLHTATNLQSRVRAVVDLLLDKHDSDGQNALFLLLTVLSENYRPADAMHLELLDLASELQTALDPWKPTRTKTDKNFVSLQFSVDVTLSLTFLTLTIRTRLELRIHW